MELPNARPDIVCLAQRRWSSVHGRPQHLMRRFGRSRRVFFCEQPVFGEESNPRLEVNPAAEGVFVVRPMLPAGLEPEALDIVQGLLLNAMLREMQVQSYVLWHDSPLALGFTEHFAPAAVVYDCTDDPGTQKGAPAALAARERQLLGRSDLVFAAGRSLSEAKRPRHPHVHVFPNSVDAAHFAGARALRGKGEPAEQRGLPHPRVGYMGAIDARLDFDLLDFVARSRPDWQVVLAGPVEVDPQSLPRRPNVHYLEAKSYDELPGYLAGWDAALLPFALRPSNRFVSPAQTLEYLAAGCPVVSTPLPDVSRPYGEARVVRIAGAQESFVREIAAALARDRADAGRARAVEALLRGLSWDRTAEAMEVLLQQAVARRAAAPVPVRAAAAARPARAKRPVRAIARASAGARARALAARELH
jgi:UDP-galactopyranose mutase